MQHNSTVQRRSLVSSPARKKTVVLALLSGVSVLVGSCGVIGDRAPSQETVLPLLREEAQELKGEGENLDPAYGVTANWEIEDVQVRKLSNEDGPPWRGTIRFKITSRVREPDGTTSTEDFVKNFEYVWDIELDSWTVR